MAFIFVLGKKSTNEKNMDLLSNQANLDFHVSTRPPFITCHLSTWKRVGKILHGISESVLLLLLVWGIG